MTTIVPTGGMIIQNTGRMKAFLSSCVGLGLYDSKQRFGGLLHILLPEPISSIPDSHTTYYARTGIPIFIEAMKAKGAKTQDMIAFIAGGALVNPLSSQEMSLNIGHKTLEITLSFMKSNGIPIKMFEASGVNPFSINLHIDTGTCSIDQVLDRKVSEKPPNTHLDLDHIAATINKLFPVPQIALSLANMLSDEESDISAIAAEIKRDQVLSANVLRLCNSSYLSLPRQIASIDQAIIYLGSKTLIQMIITAQTEKIFHGREHGYSLSRGGMYQHSLAVARLSERLAKAHGGIAPDVAYTAGLLHDIGKVILDQHIADIQPLFYRTMYDQNLHTDSCVLERDLFGIDHCQAGLILTEEWSLPDIIKDVILFHHSPGSAENNRKMINLIYLADVFADKFLAGLEIEKISTADMEESMDLLNLKPQNVYEHLSVLAESF